MMKGFESFYPAGRKLLSYAKDDLKVWQLVDMDQLERWHAGRLALIGDAAHPFLPCKLAKSPCTFIALLTGF